MVVILDKVDLDVE